MFSWLGGIYITVFIIFNFVFSNFNKHAFTIFYIKKMFIRKKIVKNNNKKLQMNMSLNSSNLEQSSFKQTVEAKNE